MHNHHEASPNTGAVPSIQLQSTVSKNPKFFTREQRAEYKASNTATEDKIIAQAMSILVRRMKTAGPVLTNPTTVQNYLRLKLGSQQRETMAILYLDVKNRLIAYDEPFHGTLTQTSVHPREIVRAALGYNAAGIVIAHCHPSGDSKPSSADHVLTGAIKMACNLVDVRLLDHIIVTATDEYSFAEHGDI